SWSSTRNPTLWRVSSYSAPMLPSPAMRYFMIRKIGTYSDTALSVKIPVNEKKSHPQGMGFLMDSSDCLFLALSLGSRGCATFGRGCSFRRSGSSFFENLGRTRYFYHSNRRVLRIEELEVFNFHIPDFDRMVEVQRADIDIDM